MNEKCETCINSTPKGDDIYCVDCKWSSKLPDSYERVKLTFEEWFDKTWTRSADDMAIRLKNPRMLKITYNEPNTAWISIVFKSVLSKCWEAGGENL